ncbi:MAG: sulfatase [Kiritimatiellae bacterium]|nr:sulfatase [Kiritimatiellia bacterium]
MNRLFSRRDFLASAGAAALSAWLRPLAFAGPADGHRPNVLFISLDDLNDWVGCLGGHPHARTPNIDRLAARGMLFTNAHCPAVICQPSRAALLSGIRPSTSGLYGFSDHRQNAVLKDAVMLPQYFKQNGYYAFGAGKVFHLGDTDPISWNAYWPSKIRNRPNKTIPLTEDLPGNGFAELSVPVNFEANGIDWAAMDVADSEMEDGKDTDWVCRQLLKRHDHPFFLGYGSSKPHQCWYGPRKYFDMHPLAEVEPPLIKADDDADLPPIAKGWTRTGDYNLVKKHGALREAARAYLALGSYTDALVGRVLDALDQSPYANNTIVMLWSDHGYHLGEKLRYHKSALWEETTRVPLIVVAPGVTTPGARCGRPVSLMDMYPTLVELCGLPPKSGLEALSLVPLLKNPAAARAQPALTTHNRNNHTLRSERWRYTRYSDGGEELYDHENDPNEWHNLANDPAYASIKAEHRAWLPTVNR